jgi:aryl-alcohol dehydrogenase-like predicted oxidoreductase
MGHISPQGQCPENLPTRRQFVSGVVLGAAAAGCSGGGVQGTLDGAATASRKTASDQVTLGSTGIRVSRLALGSGTHGSGGTSDQTKLGVPALAGLLTHGYSSGLTFFDTAAEYGSHAAVREAIKQVGRQNVIVLTKTRASTAAEMEADLTKFRTELGVDMIDIVLLHGMTEPTWTINCAGAMQVLSRAKKTGTIRAHGTSCHGIEALRLAAQTPWVEVDLARINPAGLIMDADPTTVIGVLRQMKAAGKGVIGMKILAEGQLAGDLDSALAHAVGLDAIDAFSIGFTTPAQLDEVVKKIATV